jgi:YD repeat-containing protein
MQVEGSGTTGNHTFTYDEGDKIIEMTDNSSSKYKMTYDKSGNLLQIAVEDGHFRRNLDFYYSKK